MVNRLCETENPEFPLHQGEMRVSLNLPSEMGPCIEVWLQLIKQIFKNKQNT